MIRIGCIGVGAINAQIHEPGIRASKDLELVAICDSNEDLLRQRAQEYGIPEERCFTDYHDLIDCEDVDAVDIAVANFMHMEIALYAAEKGKAYGLEKPIALNAEEAEPLVNITREKKIPSVIFFSYRYKPAARYMRALIESGRIGKIYHVNMIYYQQWGLPKANTPYVWRFNKKLTGSGALGDLGSHAMDLASFVTGVEYTSVSAHNGTFIKERPIPGTDRMGTVDVDDYSNILAETKQGIPCTFQISRFGYLCPNHQRMEVYGEKGVLVYWIDFEPNVDAVEIKEGEKEEFVRLDIPEEYTVSQMQEFADAINGVGDGLTATIEEGYVNQKLLDVVIRSAEERRWEEIR